MKRILIIGEENSNRSQMAEGWMRYYTKGYAEVTSAGLVKGELDLFAANAMSQAIMDISKQQSKPLESVMDKEFDFVLFLFENAEPAALSFKGKPKIVVQPFLKPLISASKSETEASYGVLRDDIENFCFDFVHQHIRKMY